MILSFSPPVKPSGGVFFPARQGRIGGSGKNRGRLGGSGWFEKIPVSNLGGFVV